LPTASFPRSPAESFPTRAREVATYLPLPSLPEGARVLHDRDEDLTALQLPTRVGPVLLIMPPADGFEYLLVHEGDEIRRIIGTVREDRRVSRSTSRQIAYRVAELLHTRALI
jgi:hypothetical protein